jgi:hypothetical protein
MAGAFNYASKRYMHAETISKNRAHTRVGKEGYEYIFDPQTQIFIDKILPNKNIIITSIVLLDYLPLNTNYIRELLDNDVYSWMRFEIFYPYDPLPVVIRLLIYASIAALLFGFGFYLLSIDPKNS